MEPKDWVLLCLLAAAVVFDVASRRIPNLLIVTGLCLGLGIAHSSGGASQAGWGLLGAITGTALFLPFYALRWLGAGDVKLLGVVGAFTGSAAVCWIALYTLISGGVLGLAALALSRRGYLTFGELTALLVQAARDAARTAPAADAGASTPAQAAGGARAPALRGTGPSLPYAIAVACGTLLWWWTR